MHTDQIRVLLRSEPEQDSPYRGTPSPIEDSPHPFSHAAVAIEASNDTATAGSPSACSPATPVRTQKFTPVFGAPTKIVPLGRLGTFRGDPPTTPTRIVDSTHSRIDVGLDTRPFDGKLKRLWLAGKSRLSNLDKTTIYK